MKTVIKRNLLPFFERYFRIRMFWPVWFFFINCRPRALWKRNYKKLNAVEEHVLADLKKNGIALVHCEELFPGKNIFSELVQEGSRLRAKKEGEKRNQEKLTKPFLINLFDSSPYVDLEDCFVRFALIPNIIAIVNTYLQMYARMYYMTLNVTTPVGKDTQAVASQRWHRDPEDRKMCKVFLYLNDVDENAGPFMYVRQSCCGLKYGSLFPQKPPIGVYPDATILEKKIAKEDIKTCTGRAGTIIFCDTSGLHKGGYATECERIMFTVGYRTNGAVTPNRIRYPKGYQKKLQALEVFGASRYAAESFGVSKLNRTLFSYTQRWKEELDGKNTYHE